MFNGEIEGHKKCVKITKSKRMTADTSICEIDPKENFTNILWVAFSYKSVIQGFWVSNFSDKDNLFKSSS